MKRNPTIWTLLLVCDNHGKGKLALQGLQSISQHASCSETNHVVLIIPLPPTK